MEVAEGRTICSLAVRLGRGINSQECSLVILAAGGPELLHAIARDILRAHGEPDPDPSAPYPRPIIGSRSRLEVVSRQIADILGQVARDWTP